MFLFSSGGHHPFPFVFEKNQHGPKRVMFVFYVTSPLAVLCSEAFNSHRFTSVNGWSPDRQRSVCSFEAVFVHPHQFIKEPDWIRRLTKKSYSRWAATESVCDQKWFSLRSRGVRGPKTSLGMEGWRFFSLPPPTINYSNPDTTFEAHLGQFWFYYVSLKAHGITNIYNDWDTNVSNHSKGLFLIVAVASCISLLCTYGFIFLTFVPADCPCSLLIPFTAFCEAISLKPSQDVRFQRVPICILNIPNAGHLGNFWYTYVNDFYFHCHDKRSVISPSQIVPMMKNEPHLFPFF